MTMQIGILVGGFSDLDGTLVMNISFWFNHPSGQRGQGSLSAPFTATGPQVIALTRQAIIDGYGITPPANAATRVIGF
jgi:hypothetical protein